MCTLFTVAIKWNLWLVLALLMFVRIAHCAHNWFVVDRSHLSPCSTALSRPPNERRPIDLNFITLLKRYAVLFASHTDVVLIKVFAIKTTNDDRRGGVEMCGIDLRFASIWPYGFGMSAHQSSSSRQQRMWAVYNFITWPNVAATRLKIKMLCEIGEVCALNCFIFHWWIDREWMWHSKVD